MRKELLNFCLDALLFYAFLLSAGAEANPGISLDSFALMAAFNLLVFSIPVVGGALAAFMGSLEIAAKMKGLLGASLMLAFRLSALISLASFISGAGLGKGYAVIKFTVVVFIYVLLLPYEARMAFAKEK